MTGAGDVLAPTAPADCTFQNAPVSAAKSHPAAPVNRILPLSTVDGPGARAAIFLQGCNIACRYCHNPETQRLCIHCGDCVPVCPAGALSMRDGRVQWDDAKCIGCDACLAACRHFATPKVKWMTAGQVMDAVRPNRPFLRGITVSGGECTLYPDFLTELFTLAQKEGLTCLLDSNGATDLQALPALMAVTDGVMLDVKAWEPAVYAALTGSSDDARVKRNLAFLADAGKLTELRIVYLPGEVDAQAVIDGSAALLGNKKKDVRLKLISFRGFGVRGALENMASPTAEEMQALQRHAQQAGFCDIAVV